MPDFATRADAAERLMAAISGVPADLVVTDEATVLAALTRAGRTAALVDLVRTDDDVQVTSCPRADAVIVAVLGVETGRTAAALATHLRDHGAQSITLAAAVLPRQTEHALGRRFDGYLALVRPLAPRDLRWHIG